MQPEDVSSLAKICSFFNVDMSRNLVAEALGIVATVFVLDRYFAWRDDKNKRAARQLLVEDIGTRLDFLASDWHWTTSEMAQVSVSGSLKRAIEQRTKLGKKIKDAVEKSKYLLEHPFGHAELDDGIRVQAEAIFEVAAALPDIESLPDDQKPDLMAVQIRRVHARVEHIVSRLSDVLGVVDSAAVIMTPAILTRLVTLRRLVLEYLSPVRDLGSLLGTPTEAEARELRSSALQASFNAPDFLAVLQMMWDEIPAKEERPLRRFEFLEKVSSKLEQRKVIDDFLSVVHPIALGTDV